MEDKTLSIKNQIEALLFIWGDPIDKKEIYDYFNSDKFIIDDAIDTLIYEYQNRGIRLQVMGNMIQLNTNPKYYALIENFGINQKKKSLSAASLETLSIISYLQPTTKAIVEQIRGVNSDGPIQTLLEKNMIREIGKLKQPGRPYVYKTTDNFLKLFEISSIDELPELKDREKIKEMLKFTEISEEDIEYLEDIIEEKNGEDRV